MVHKKFHSCILNFTIKTNQILLQNFFFISNWLYKLKVFFFFRKYKLKVLLLVQIEGMCYLMLLSSSLIVDGLLWVTKKKEFIFSTLAVIELYAIIPKNIFGDFRIIQSKMSFPPVFQMKNEFFTYSNYTIGRSNIIIRNNPCIGRVS